MIYLIHPQKNNNIYIFHNGSYFNTQGVRNVEANSIPLRALTDKHTPI